MLQVDGQFSAIEVPSTKTKSHPRRLTAAEQPPNPETALSLSSHGQLSQVTGQFSAIEVPSTKTKSHPRRLTAAEQPPKPETELSSSAQPYSQEASSLVAVGS